jgi:hypothetical protein
VSCDCVTIENRRRSYWIGATPHFIQVLKVTQMGRWIPGVLLGVDGLVAEVLLDGATQVKRFGTLWPDRLATVAMGPVLRDHAGRPRLWWNARASVLELYEGPHRMPAFSVADLAKHPQWVTEMSALPPSCEHATRDAEG